MRKETEIILAIESSCDETSAAVVRGGRVLSNVIANQETHSVHGGVVPELASRAHQANIAPVVRQALSVAELSARDLDAVAFTRGPGLLGSLLVGVSFAKAFALALEKPLIEVNHMDAHVLAHFAEEPFPKFPFLCLTVSGGHTQIARADSPLRIEVLGRTLDDAAGEAFDKTGKLLGLPYPAGPHIDKLAEQGSPRFRFPTPQIPRLDFSFSGLKTAILYFLRDGKKDDPNFVEKNIADICASVQAAIVQILIQKLCLAARQTGIREVAIAGGVSANSGLRQALIETGAQEGWNTYAPHISYCTDNAAMIGIAAAFKYRAGIFCGQDAAPFVRA
ncbi:MAG: tRNA (adenosine(37)-N6)-threonylcarbamoyltransferase complex transferase subunit TsaD [Saprospiraceae bacterium]